MYSNAIKIEKVSNFFLDNQFKLYWKEGGLYNVQHNNLLANVKGNIFQVFKKDNLIVVNYFSSDDGMEMLCEFKINEDFKLIKTKEEKKFLKEIENNVVLELSYDSSFNTILNVVKFDGEKIIESIVDPFGFKLFETIFVSWDKLKLVLYELKKGTKLFEFSFSKLINGVNDEETNVEVVSILGVYKKVLWILVTHRKIIGLDVENGTLLHKIDLSKELGLAPNSSEDFSFSVKDVHIDNEKGIIKSLSYRYYWELNLDTFQIQIKKDFGENSKESWRINRSKYYSGDRNLYFIGTNKGEVVNRAVGVFDTENFEVIWFEAPLEERKHLFFTDVPQVNNEVLGVMDSENNLRVYERN
ncbi:hypothetical protein [Flavobacterium chungangensis]|uniref:Uncharacterized protein n=1 Tax=Flavobacterium chungangensis TaxID=2708132 RepID=A0ABV8ZCN9_9FLAO